MTDSRVRRAYDRLADSYDRRWSTYVDASTDETLSRMPLAAEMRLLDVGCGTGVLLDKVVDTYPDIETTGVDMSPEMLKVARRRLPDGVELLEADATDLPFDDDSFDLVVSTSAFHHIDRPQIALEEIHRVLDVSGTLVLTDWCTDFWTTRLLEWALRLLDPAHHRGYGADELTARVQRAGFQKLQLDRYKIQWQWGLMTLVAHRR